MLNILPKLQNSLHIAKHITQRRNCFQIAYQTFSIVKNHWQCECHNFIGSDRWLHRQYTIQPTPNFQTTLFISYNSHSRTNKHGFFKYVSIQQSFQLSAMKSVMSVPLNVGYWGPKIIESSQRLYSCTCVICIH